MKALGQGIRNNIKIINLFTILATIFENTMEIPFIIVSLNFYESGKIE